MSLNKGTCVSCGVCRAPRVIVIFNLALPLRLLRQQPSLSGAQGTCMGSMRVWVCTLVCKCIRLAKHVSEHTHESHRVLRKKERGDSNAVVNAPFMPEVFACVYSYLFNVLVLRSLNLAFSSQLCYNCSQVKMVDIKIDIAPEVNVISAPL